MRCSFPGTLDQPVREIKSDKAPAADSVLWDGGEKYGNYTILADEHIRAIFPHSRRLGKSVRVVLIHRYMHFRCDRSGATFTLSHYNHQRRWLRRDTRDKGQCTEEHQIREIARLLCGGDLILAKTLLRRYLG